MRAHLPPFRRVRPAKGRAWGEATHGFVPTVRKGTQVNTPKWQDKAWVDFLDRQWSEDAGFVARIKQSWTRFIYRILGWS